MKKGKLVIFVDAYPHKYVEFFNSTLPKSMIARKLKPTFGFSINQKALLFDGQYPDEFGYFNEWRLKPKCIGTSFLSPIDKLLSYFPHKIEGLFHRLYTRLVGEDYYRIPFAMKGFFLRNPTEVYNRNYPLPTELSNNKWSKFLYRDFNSPERDNLNFKKIKNHINKSKNPEELIFLCLADLDSGLHKVSGTGDSAIQLCKDYCYKISEIVNLYSSKFKDNEITVLSDHGMSTIEGNVNLDLNLNIGKTGYNSYLYFLDATMCRVWYFDENLKELINKHLLSNENVKKLSKSERIKYKCLSSDFGDDIFTLKKDNVMFAPSFYGRKSVKGMHGYIPDYKSQFGIYISNKNLNEKEINAEEVYSHLFN